ncbi:MAG: hypothetical protein C4530_21320 [Desulfobacteraceae bacterium]|nr:MAG: hypothetical protein C4530_21320 [Desulfobacteraceae bacterium]
MNHFCENPECEFNIVPCRPDTDRIKMPGGREIRRHGIDCGDRQIFLCDRCRSAVGLVTDKAVECAIC